MHDSTVTRCQSVSLSGVSICQNAECEDSDSDSDSDSDFFTHVNCVMVKYADLSDDDDDQNDV